MLAVKDLEADILIPFAKYIYLLEKLENVA